MLLEWLIGGAVVSKVVKGVVKETKKAEAEKTMKINAQLAEQEEIKRAQEFEQEQKIASQRFVFESQQQRAEQAARLREKSIQDRIEAIKAGVPKIPVYQPVSATCPCCSGNRKMDMKQGMAKCSFCGFEEPLKLLRYENDYSTIEEKVAEAYRQVSQEEFDPPPITPTSNGSPTTQNPAATGCAGCATTVMGVLLLVGTVVYAIFSL